MKWEKLDFMSNNDVTSVDMVIVDEEGCLYCIDKLHFADAKPKFHQASSEKRCFFRSNTSVSALDAYYVAIIPYKFCFTEFESLESNLPNMNLTDVYGYLKTITNIQVLHRAGGQSSRLHETTLENLLGTTLKIALWGSTVNQVGNDPIDCEHYSRPCLGCSLLHLCGELPRY
ncbi:hypothetical protein MKX01_020957 [Papaver californicum]|nr:hypothetical protein MKX01_020957 [Papaver californicum]